MSERQAAEPVPRSLLVCSLEAGGVAGFVAMVLETCQRFFMATSGLAGGPSELLLLASLPLGYYLADLLSGLIHWVCDSFGNEHTPLWGPMLVGPFRRHHRDPLQITRISLLENLGASALAGLLVLALWSPEAAHTLPGQALQWTLLSMIVFAVLSNLFHRWSHLPLARRPVWMRWVQRRGLLLDSREHAQHHRRPHRVNYCILCGWANPLSNRLPWARIEALLARLGVRTCFD